MSLHAAPRMPAARHQQGLLSVASLGWLVLAGCAVYLLLKTAPALSEHARVKVLVRSIAAAAPATPQAAQEAFDRQKTIDRIESLDGRNLTVTREDGVLVISYGYDRKIVLFGGVSLLIRYDGTTREAAQ
jgi:hypothetical protein